MKGVIFDHTTLLVSATRARLVAGLRELLLELKALDLRIIVLSTHRQDITTSFNERGFPDVDLYLTRSEVGVNKGSPKWVHHAASLLAMEPHDFLYVGSDEWDWRTAINAATLYLHAGWTGPIPGGVTAIVAGKPEDVLLYSTHFLLLPPRWEYVLDDEQYGLHLRCLLGAGVALPSTKPASRFTLQNVLTYRIRVVVGDTPAGDLLMLHAITSLYSEGLIARNSPFAIYPSSKPGQLSPVLEKFVRPAARLFHGYFRHDLLIRAAEALDTSLERVQARNEGRAAKVSLINQANTVHVNRMRLNLIQHRTVIVIDDFTTTGMSLDWARNLLYAAGAARVILITVGKYPRPHTVYLPIHSDIVDPFQQKKYTLDMFKSVQVSMTQDPVAQACTRRSFEFWKDGKPYSPTVAAQG